MGSDHIMFIGSGINGVGLSQENVDGIIHTLEDTIDKVDIRYLEELSETLVDFIVNNSEKIFPLVKAVGNLDDIISAELINLKFNEYKYVEIKGSKKPKVIYQEYSENEISEEKIVIENEVYNPVYRKSNNNLRGLYREVEYKNNIYKVMITAPYDNEEWLFKTIEESVNFYQEFNLSPVMD